MPKPASPASNANIPRPTTTIPADLKNRGAYFECANEADPNDKSASIGKVPSAKANITKDPNIKDPLESAATCIDWVNPQGKKKVPTPIKIGAQVVCSTFLKKENK